MVMAIGPVHPDSEMIGVYIFALSARCHYLILHNFLIAARNGVWSFFHELPPVSMLTQNHYVSNMLFDFRRWVFYVVIVASTSTNETRCSSPKTIPTRMQAFIICIRDKSKTEIL